MDINFANIAIVSHELQMIMNISLVIAKVFKKNNRQKRIIPILSQKTSTLTKALEVFTFNRIHFLKIGPKKSQKIRKNVKIIIHISSRIVVE